MHGQFALASSDALIVSGMFTSIVVAIALAAWSRVVVVRVGLIACSVVAGVGWAHFGFKPFVGEGRTAESYFGCTLLCLALLAGCVLVAIEAVGRPRESEARGFPVEPAASEPEERQ